MIVVDVETSGLDPKEHSILSIGALDFDNPKNTFYGECRLKEGARIDQSALNVNGFTVEKINNSLMSCRQLIEKFLEWSLKFNNRTLAGHNFHFDYNFLLEHFKFYNLIWPFRHRFVDLHSVFYFNMLKHNIDIPLNGGVSNLTLDFIIDYLQLNKREGHHNALEDAQLTAQALLLLMK